MYLLRLLLKTCIIGNFDERYLQLKYRLYGNRIWKSCHQVELRRMAQSLNGCRTSTENVEGHYSSDTLNKAVVVKLVMLCF